VDRSAEVPSRSVAVPQVGQRFAGVVVDGMKLVRRRWPGALGSHQMPPQSGHAGSSKSSNRRSTRTPPQSGHGPVRGFVSRATRGRRIANAETMVAANTIATASVSLIVAAQRIGAQLPGAASDDATTGGRARVMTADRPANGGPTPHADQAATSALQRLVGQQLTSATSRIPSRETPGSTCTPLLRSLPRRANRVAARTRRASHARPLPRPEQWTVRCDRSLGCAARW
jgi:hypothetical protein